MLPLMLANKADFYIFLWRDMGQKKYKKQKRRKTENIIDQMETKRPSM